MWAVKTETPKSEPIIILNNNNRKNNTNLHDSFNDNHYDNDYHNQLKLRYIIFDPSKSSPPSEWKLRLESRVAQLNIIN